MTLTHLISSLSNAILAIREDMMVSGYNEDEINQKVYAIVKEAMDKKPVEVLTDEAGWIVEVRWDRAET